MKSTTLIRLITSCVWCDAFTMDGWNGPRRKIIGTNGYCFSLLERERELHIDIGIIYVSKEKSLGRSLEEDLERIQRMER